MWWNIRNAHSTWIPTRIVISMGYLGIFWKKKNWWENEKSYPRYKNVIFFTRAESRKAQLCRISRFSLSTAWNVSVFIENTQYRHQKLYWTSKVPNISTFDWNFSQARANLIFGRYFCSSLGFNFDNRATFSE